MNVNLRWLVCILIALQIGGCGKSKTDKESYTHLSEQDIQLIDDYVSSASVEDDIGQLLMVGVPADLNTAEDTDNRALDELIASNGVGMVIVNGYNYYDSNKSADDNEYLTRVIVFNNLLQRKTRNSKSKLPLLIATDFENPSFPSIKRGLILPPSALSLSTTQDGQLIRSIGRYIGTELTSVGVQIILGPVLDTNNVKQGNKNILQDRCFAATSEGVARTASHYISGLSESGIVVFAKHYPSHGSIETDPHKEVIPLYEGSKEQLQVELKPFIQSKENIHGVMTSHIQVASSKVGGMATFSPEIIGDLKKHGLNKKIIITDDLSAMGAIRKHMADNRKSYQDVALDSFIAGHDVLLFSHISDEKKRKSNAATSYRESNFTLKDLNQVRNKLVEYINSSEQARGRFKESLRKVLIVKSQVAKMKSNEPLARFLGRKEGNDTAFNFQIRSDGRTAIEDTEQSMAKADLPTSLGNIPEGSIGKKLVMEGIRKSVIWINNPNKIDLNLFNRAIQTKIIFAVYDDQLAKFKQTFAPHFANAKYIGIPFRKDTGEYAKLENEINTSFGKDALLIYTARDGSDADLLKRLRNKNRKIYSENVIVFVHNSPAIFDNDIISDSTAIGNFSMHPYSFDTDIELLSSTTFQPRGLDSIPINIGDNGKFYHVSNTKWVEPANPNAFGELFPQQSNLVSMRDIKKQYWLISKSLADSINSLIVFVIIILATVLIYWWPRHHLKHAVKAGTFMTFLARQWVSEIFAALVFLVLISIASGNAIFFKFLHNAKDTSATMNSVLTDFK